MISGTSKHSHEFAPENSIKDLRLIAYRRLLHLWTHLDGDRLTLPMLLDQVSRVAVPHLADWCAILIDQPVREQHFIIHSLLPESAHLESVIRPLRIDVERVRELALKLSKSGPCYGEKISSFLINDLGADDRVQAELSPFDHAPFSCAALTGDGFTGVMLVGKLLSGWRFEQEYCELLEEFATNAGSLLRHWLHDRSADERLDTMASLISVASHELKTPLTSLTLQVNTIERMISLGMLDYQNEQAGQDPQAAERHSRNLAKLVKSVERNLAYHSHLVNNLFHQSQIKSGQFQIQPRLIDLVQIVAECVERFAYELESHQSAVEINSPPVIMGHWDPLRLQQVFTNLVSNAIKYGKGKPIEISMITDATHVQIIVSDRGIGIRRELCQKIFEPYQRAVPIGTSVGGLGLGLGLYLTKSIVEAHGGSIAVESEEGAGSRFIVRLPFVDTESLPQSRIKLL